MDHHHYHAGRNVIRPEPRSVAPQPHQSQHPHHHQNINLHHPHNYQPTLHQQATATSGTTMRGLVLDSEYILERPVFLAPNSAPILRAHGIAPTSGESHVAPEPSPPSTFAEGGSKTFGRKRSRKRPKTCGVCSDRAKSFHFGGLSCDSCKAFFRRSVQNDAHVAFRCAYDSCCDINISTRKSCQFCRFKKCLSIGMEKSWVMTEEERNALNQQRLEKKQTKPAGGNANQPQQHQPEQDLEEVANSPSTPPQHQSPNQHVHRQGASTPSSTTSSSTALPEASYTFQGSTTSSEPASSDLPAALAFQESEYVADVDQMLDYMTYEDQVEIKTVVETYLHAYKEMPFRVSFEEGRRDTLEIIEMFTTILRRFAYFAKLNPEFSDLSKNDQGNLLRAAVLEMCLLRGAACFDTENNRWPNSTMESLKNCPQLRVEDMQRLVSRELFEMHITFIFHMKRLRIDEPIAMLLIMTVLFSPEHIPVEDKIKINQAQEKYLMLLKKYVTWKFGTTAGSRIYPQLLTKLSDLRQLNDFHTEFHLNLDRKEVNAIRKSLMELDLRYNTVINPYPNWKIVPESQSSTRDSRATSPVLPAPSPMLEAGATSSMPLMAQRLLQSFADTRIPTLLDNPYSEFETDLGMIRHVQQTLGSLFPAAGQQSSLFTSNAQPTHHQQRRYPSGDAEGAAGTHFSKHDSLFSSSKSTPTSTSPHYSSSTDSAEAQALDILEPSRTAEFQAPSTSSSSSSQFGNVPPGEYHAERLHQFLHHRGGGSAVYETVTSSVIQGLRPAPGPSSLTSGSQHPPTVLRKHSSSGSSLPGTPSSVIRSAPARTAESSSTSSAGPPISCGTVSEGGWHGGEVTTTTTNGHGQPTESAAITVTTRMQPPPLYSDLDENDELSFRKN